MKINYGQYKIMRTITNALGLAHIITFIVWSEIINVNIILLTIKEIKF